MKKTTVISAIVPAIMMTACGADFIGLPDAGNDAVATDVPVDVQSPDAVIADTADDTRAHDVVETDSVADADLDAVQPIDADDIAGDATDINETDLNVPFLEERAGWAWNSSPADGSPTQVVYKHLESRQGKLTGKFAEVWNCLREDGGPVEQMYWNGVNYNVQLCNYAQTVVPDDDGTYLYLVPPTSPKDGSDAFAEGHSYYSVNRVHDFYGDSFGHTANDRALFTVVNMGFKIEDSPRWMPLDNAAYLPDASYGFMGFNMHDGEMLAFGQGSDVDFCSDASVIFHEYTHFVVGSNRLSLNTGDKYGFSGDPPGMNEGFADYFASTILDYPVLGEYSLGDDSRDLSEFKRCPDDYVGESHYDGRIWSSTMWEIRTTLGALFADELAYRTLIATEQTSTFKTASAAMLEICQEIAPENLEIVRGILESHNVVDCARVLEYGTELGDKGYYVPGKMDSYAYEFQSSVASTFQYKIVVPEGSTGFTAYFRAEDMYGEDSAPAVKLMVRRGDSPIEWHYSGRAVADADKAFSGTRMNSKDVSFNVSGDCVTPGVYHIQLVNNASYMIVSKLNSVEFQSAAETPTWSGCGTPDDGVVDSTADVIEDVNVPDVVDSDVTDPDVVGPDVI